MKSLTLIAVLSLFGSAFALFGPEKEVLLIIDPGHGGRDRGAQTEELDEASLNLTWAKELQVQAEKEGIKTLLTRNSDQFLDLKERVEFSKSHADENAIFISLHQEMHNTETPSGSRLRVAEDASSGCLGLAEKVADDLDIPMEQASLFVLNESSCPSFMLSLGFMSNPSDVEKMTSETYRADFNEMLIESILN